jgi:ubiquinone/menaquinone biosynthesis C-methylase UbiE
MQTLKQFRSEGIEGYFAMKYAEFAKETPAMRESYANLAERVAAIISEGTFLEVGPGPAFISIEIARRIPQAQIIGLDISETMIGIGRRNVAEAGFSEKITFRLGDAAKMPFGDAEFDFVVSSGSLHHWSEPIEVFDEIYRVLKLNQLALVYDVRKDAPKEKVDEFSRNVKSWFMRWGLRHSIGESYTQQGIEELLSLTRFKEAKRIELDDLGMFIWLRMVSDVKNVHQTFSCCY